MAAIFVWLWRAIGDDWQPSVPEVAPEEGGATTIRNEDAMAEPTSAVMVTEGAAPPAPRPEPAPSRTIATAIPVAAVAAAAVAPALDETAAAEPATVTTIHAPWSLLWCGLLLLLGVLATSSAIPEGERGGLLVLGLLGGLTAFLGARSILAGHLPGWLGGLLARLGHYFAISEGQVVLLLLALPFSLLARLAAGNGLLARQPAVAVLAWLLAIALAVVGSVSRETSAAAPRRAFDRRDWLIMAGLFVVALLLRGVATAQFPPTYSGDEGSAGLFAIEQLQGLANNPFSLGWFSFPSLYFLVQSVAIGLGGQTVEAVRLTSALAGALSVVALYALGRSMFDRTTAVLAATYLAASHFHIHMSRIALNNVWDGLFGTLAILGLWAGWKSGRRDAFILCGLALGLGQYFYVSIRVLPVLFLIWAATAWLVQRTQFRQRLPGLVLAAFIALVVFLPLGLYFADKPDEFQAPMNRVTIFGDWLEHELALGQRTTAEILSDQALLGAMGFVSEPMKLLYDPGSPLLLAGAATLFILGILWALLHFDLRYWLLILPLLAAIAANTVSQGSPASQRYILAMPLVALFVALPLGEAIALVRERRPNSQRLALGAAAVIMGLLVVVDLNYYFNKVYDTYVLGGGNTTAATAIATTLRDEEPAAQDVYFFGFPRMGYFSLSTIPFLAPEMRGQDVTEPLTGPPTWSLAGPTLFVFLPERLGELALVQQSYPNGRYEEFFDRNGQLLFALYAVAP